MFLYLNPNKVKSLISNSIANKKSMSTQKLIGELAKWATDEITPRPLNIVLKYLIDQIVEQGKSINQLEKSLGQHITNPFRTGTIYLEEANSAFDEQSQRDNLKKAIDSFIAVAQLDTMDFPIVAVKSQFYIGACYDLLEERGAAIRWYERSYKSALDEADKISDNLSKPTQHLNIRKKPLCMGL